jgi:hypothetical protein
MERYREAAAPSILAVPSFRPARQKNKNEAEFCIGKKGRRLKFSSAEDESL